MGARHAGLQAVLVARAITAILQSTLESPLLIAMFTSVLALEPAGDGVFHAPASPDKGRATFGGQFLAQSLHAAERTVATDREPNSLHAYFIRPGDVDRPSQVTVDTVRDGRTFSTRAVEVTQNDKALFRMLVSFQVPDSTPEYNGAGMPKVPSPDRVSYSYDDFTTDQTGDSDWYGSARPIDILYINPPRERRPVTESQLMWMRIRESLPDDAGVHRAGLAYMSDATLVDHVLLPHGLRWQDKDFAGTSLDHAMWFHRPARADEWLMFEQTVEATGRGRGLVSGRLYNRAGLLVANCMQEGLMRWTGAVPGAASDCG